MDVELLSEEGSISRDDWSTESALHGKHAREELHTSVGRAERNADLFKSPACSM